MTVAAARWAHQIVESAIGCEAEQVVIGTSHVGMLSAGLGWPGARLVVRSGPDGADLALIDVLEHEAVAERFDEVVLVSGDGIFTDVVARLGAAGVRVTVVGHVGHVSKRLSMVAADTMYFVADVEDWGMAA